MEHFDILIIGGGAAGIAAAKGAYSAGCKRIALVDRKSDLGGVLLQCAHNGFGPGLTGPEYLKNLTADFPPEVRFFANTTVLSLSPEREARLSGGITLTFERLILATGCREIPIGALPIAGTRPAGIYTAGQMQEMMNLHGFVPEGPAVILGSGDLGLVMAKHLAERGIAVTLVERLPHCGGMARNRRCLREYPIKLITGTTITEVRGGKQLEAVVLQGSIPIPCKTLLIAAGLRPEQTLIHHLGNPDWLYLCGNCHMVHPMVEAVIHEGTHSGIAAWESIGERTYD